MSILDKFRSTFTFGTTGLESDGDSASDAAVEKEERRRNKRINARDETRALIIDDSPTIVFALKKILQSAGFITLEAQDAETGIGVARAEIPDLIFLDIILPGVNGFAALRSLRKDQSTTHIPIIMISGNEQATEPDLGRDDSGRHLERQRRLPLTATGCAPHRGAADVPKMERTRYNCVLAQFVGRLKWKEVPTPTMLSTSIELRCS